MENQEHGFGALPSPKDVRDYQLKVQALASIQVPNEYRLDKIPIKDQGTKPTCTAHTLAELIEYHNQRQSGKFTRFSTDFIYGLRFNGDYMGDGMYIRDALSKIQNYGDLTYASMPGNSDVAQAQNKVISNLEAHKKEAFPNRISTYYRIRNFNELKYAVSHNGPVVVGMKWYTGARLDSNFVYTYNPENQFDGHAVLVVGYDESHMIIQNSWGTYWGKNGYFKVRKEDFDALFFDVFGVTDNITDIKVPNKITFTLSPVINKILNFFSNWFKK